MNSLFFCVFFVAISIISALPAPQAPSAPPAPPGPFTAMFQTAGAVANAGFTEAARFASIFPTAADSALGVGQTLFGRVLSGFAGFAAGK